MKTRIGQFNAATRTVPVLFTYIGVRHRRAVNACLDDDGNYDEAATHQRVAEVARGVANKIDAGVIR